jgi:hypothetical protein
MQAQTCRTGTSKSNKRQGLSKEEVSGKNSRNEDFQFELECAQADHLPN